MGRAALLLLFQLELNTSNAKHHWQAFPVISPLSHTPLHYAGLPLFPIDLAMKQNNHFKAGSATP